MIAMAGEGRINVADVVSHVTDINGIEDAFERLRKGDGARTLVILDESIAGSLEGIKKA
jgi:Zn-dependent alcohol dehydrogenase